MLTLSQITELQSRFNLIEKGLVVSKEVSDETKKVAQAAYQASIEADKHTQNIRLRRVGPQDYGKPYTSAETHSDNAYNHAIGAMMEHNLGRTWWAYRKHARAAEQHDSAAVAHKQLRQHAASRKHREAAMLHREVVANLQADGEVPMPRPEDQ